MFNRFPHESENLFISSYWAPTWGSCPAWFGSEFWRRATRCQWEYITANSLVRQQQ